MTSLFRSRGFDSLIGKGTTIHGEMRIAANSTALIEGNGYLSSVLGETIDGKVSAKTTLHVNGQLQDAADGTPLNIEVHNVIITGKVVCKTIRVEGTLAVKAGATLIAEKILYRELIIETGAVVHGQMSHLDYVSEGEIV
jgi:cytoskeletal protein CcmA (bactofilin family)